MSQHNQQTKIEQVIRQIQECADKVYEALGPGYPESTYEKAMEIALRKAGLVFETQRIVPIMFEDVVIRDARDEIDLVVWVEDNGKRYAIVADLKAVNKITATEENQVARYKRSLARVLKDNEEVCDVGLVINFPQSATQKPSPSKPLSKTSKNLEILLV